MRVHLNSSRSYAAGRLQTAGVVNPNLLTIQSIDYGSGGSADNIVVKSDVGQFKYIGGKIHALSYTDNAATQVSTQTQKVSYTPFHRPDSLTEGDWLMTFAYGPDYERRRTDLYKLGTLTERRHYFGSGSERHENVTTGTSRDLFYIPGPDGLAAIMKREGSVVQLYFPYADHLGSVTSLTDELGNVVCRQAFDPWGRRRNPGSLLIDDNALPANYAWLRGFTGHEHLPQFKLINMNARLYDPLLGRMLSPDNYVTDASNAMTYNLYSYANNNPLSYVDPDGNWALIDDAVAMLLGAGINVISNALSGNIGSFADFIGYAAVGAASGEAGLYGGPMAAGMIAGAGNNLVAQLGANNWSLSSVDAGQMIGSGVIGGFMGVAGAALGGLAPQISGIASPVLRGAVNGAVGGMGVGMILGAGSGFLETGTLQGALLGGIQGGMQGAAIGAIGGSIEGYKSAKLSGRNPWTGQYNKVDITPLPMSPDHPLPYDYPLGESMSDVNPYNSTKYGPSVRMYHDNGRVTELNSTRVKRFLPSNHPNAPAGRPTIKMRYYNPSTESYSYKRVPYTDEINFLVIMHMLKALRGH